MATSPPVSPISLLRAQLIVEKAKLTNKKAKDSAKAPSKTTVKRGPGRPKKQEPALDKFTDKSNLEDDEGDSEKENSRGESDCINWLEVPNDTFRLLAIIEENACYQKAFGFQGGDDGGTTSGGLTIAQVSRNIGEKLFPKSSLLVDKIGKSVSSRVRVLKKKYMECRKALGQTGHGLVIEDRTTEIISGTPIANVWDKMSIRFPWYSKMHALLHGNPNHNKSAQANSSTPLNTSVLATCPQSKPPGPNSALAVVMQIPPSERQETPEWDFDQMDASFASCNGLPDSGEHLSHSPSSSPLPQAAPHAGSHTTSAIRVTPSLTTKDDDPNPKPNCDTNTQPDSKEGSVTNTKPVADLPAGVKHKDLYQHVQQLTETYSASRLKTEKLCAATKRQHIDTNLQIQLLKNEDSEKQRQHELLLLEKQIFLVQIQANNKA